MSFEFEFEFENSSELTETSLSCWVWVSPISLEFDCEFPDRDSSAWLLLALVSNCCKGSLTITPEPDVGEDGYSGDVFSVSISLFTKGFIGLVCSARRL